MPGTVENRTKMKNAAEVVGLLKRLADAARD
jgi:hypothetical protein